MKCYLIGNGPSLTPERLDGIVGQFSFAVNAIGSMYDKTAWRPTVYVLANNGYEYGLRKADYDRSMAGSVYASKSYEGLFSATFLEMREFPDTDKWMVEWWSDNPNQWVSKYGTSLLVCAQLAAYWRFDEIVLMGCDGYKGQLHYGGYPEWADDFDVDKFEKSRAGAEALMQFHLKRLGIRYTYV